MDEFLEEVLPAGWSAQDELLVCPHDVVIELDGSCPQGCVSPLRSLGLI